MKKDDLYEPFASKSSEELLGIISAERQSYTQNAIQTAEAILTERGIEFQRSEIIEIAPEKTESVKPFMPMIVGAGMVLLVFYKPTVSTIDTETALTVNIVLNVAIRLVVVLWLSELVKTFTLNRTLWLILGVVFGGWALIAVNLTILLGNSRKPDSHDNETITDEHPQENPVVRHKHDFTNCPACQFALEGKEEKCPDCGLAL